MIFRTEELITGPVFFVGEENSLIDWLDAQPELSNRVHLKVKEHKKNFIAEGPSD
jgi:hypothetical protein